MGRLYDRQNCLVQAEHVRCAGFFFLSSESAREKSEGGFAGVLARSEDVLERGIMVLFEKQVHLQKDVGAEALSLVRCTSG